MSELMQTLKRLVRSELARYRVPELGIVTEVFSRDGESSDNNHQVGVRLRASGVELPRVPVAVSRLGLSSLPAVGALVVVVFIGGDLNAPVVMGAVYDDQSQPPVAEPEQVVYQPQDTGGGERRLHVELPSGAILTAEDDAVFVEAGGTQLRIDRDGDVSIQAAGSMTVEAQGDVEISAAGSLKLEGQAGVEVSGATFLAEAQGEAKLKAPALSLAGTTQFNPA